MSQGGNEGQPGRGFPWVWVSLTLAILGMLISQMAARKSMQIQQQIQQLQIQRLQQQRPQFR
jgi:hypothetical protein